MKKRVFIGRSFFAMLLVLLISASVLAAEVTLNIWAQTEYRQQEFEAMLPGFLGKNPGINVEVHLIPGDQQEFMEKLALAVASGSPPDLSWASGARVKEWVTRDVFLDVTRYVEQVRFTPAEIEELTFRGALWGAPYHTTARGLFKRVDFFENVGMDPTKDPADLDELQVWTQRLTTVSSDNSYERVGFLPWGSNWGPAAWIWAFGGQLVDETSFRPTADARENVKAFEWIQDWSTRYGPSPVRSGWRGFVDGSLAMMADSASIVGNLLQEGVQFTVGRVPHPPEGRNGTWAGGDALVIPANAPNKDEAIRLLQYFSSAEAQLTRYRSVPVVLPANWDALRQVAASLAPQYQALLDQMPEANSRTPLWGEYYAELRAAESNVIRGAKTPEQALVDVQSKLDSRFQEIFGAL